MKNNAIENARKKECDRKRRNKLNTIETHEIKCAEKQRERKFDRTRLITPSKRTRKITRLKIPQKWYAIESDTKRNVIERK
jgi:hypothetical protein